MIYVSVPFFYKNREFYNFFNYFIKQTPEATKVPMNIEFTYGAFPWSLWNGDINSSYGNAVCYPEMESFINISNASVQIDCSNTLLSNTDLFDRHQDAILKLFDNNGSAIIVGDLKVYDYIKEKYPNYKFVLSNKAELLNEFNSDIINVFIDNEDFILIDLNEPIDGIKNKNKIELIVGNQCMNCPKETRLGCLLKEQQNQMNFSNQSIYITCQKEKLNFDYLGEILHYQSLGYSHFKIAPQIHCDDLTVFNQQLIFNFIKEDYQQVFFNEYSNFLH